jgi:hypothetical protein
MSCKRELVWNLPRVQVQDSHCTSRSSVALVSCLPAGRVQIDVVVVVLKFSWRHLLMSDLGLYIPHLHYKNLLMKCIFISSCASECNRVPHLCVCR